MHFVDQVHLVPPTHRRVLDVVQQLTGILDARARSGVHFNEIDKTPSQNFFAGRTDPAGRSRNANFTIQAARQNPRDGGLADAASACEQVRMVQTIMFEGVFERLANMFLANQFSEGLWAPFPIQNFVGHGQIIREQLP